VASFLSSKERPEELRLVADPHHVLAVLVGLLTFGFAAATLRQRRPTGSAAAWLLLIVRCRTWDSALPQLAGAR